MQTDRTTERALEWLKDVAGIDDAYIARWDSSAWDQWARAMHADPAGPCPSVPQWMQPHLGRWHRDFSGPLPTLAHLWPTTHNWFTEADAHHDLTLTIDEPLDAQAPTLHDVRQAWELATARRATPLISITLIPGTPASAGVIGQIDAFYVTTDAANLVQMNDDLTRILGTATPDVDRSLIADLPTHDGHGVLAWEWMAA